MSTKRTIGEVVSVGEQTIVQETEDVEVGTETPELRPTVEMEIQGTVDYANERTTEDGRLFGQTLETYERMQARKWEIERTRERYDRDEKSVREAGNRAIVSQGSVERRRELQKRAASVNPWCDPDKTDPREELTQEQLAGVNQQSMRMAAKLGGWSRAAISRPLAERVADGVGLMSAVVGVYDELRTAPGQVISIADVQDVNRNEVSIRGRVETLWKPLHPKIQQVGLIKDDTGTIKFTVWRASGKTMVCEGETVELRSVARTWYEGRVSVAVTGWSTVFFLERGQWGK
ncbi:DNA-binding protein [Haladaptatus sp. CMAA 1911]|uniref:DNA-binding protein n=1 Tax=unclassified Haladaptatus TaxID=2622732 RepID=UPI003754617D